MKQQFCKKEATSEQTSCVMRSYILYRRNTNNVVIAGAKVLKS